MPSISLSATLGYFLSAAYSQWRNRRHSHALIKHANLSQFDEWAIYAQFTCGYHSLEHVGEIQPISIVIFFFAHFLIHSISNYYNKKTGFNRVHCKCLQTRLQLSNFSSFAMFSACDFARVCSQRCSIPVALYFIYLCQLQSNYF